jgi:hypothetical protein
MDWQAVIQTSKPQDLFLAWLFRLPDGASVERAALSEIARLDDVVANSERLRSLRGLFQQAALVNPLQPSRRRSRRH